MILLSQTYFVDSGTTFLSENFVLTLSLPLYLTLFLKPEGNNTDVEALKDVCKPKLDINSELVPQI